MLNFDYTTAAQSCRETLIVVLNGALQWRGTGAFLSALPSATRLRADPARLCQPPLSRASGERRSVHERRSRAQVQRARKFARAFWWGARTASATPPGLLIYGNTMTVTDADMNRNDIPDVLQLPQFGLAPQGFATPVLHCEQGHDDRDRC